MSEHDIVVLTDVSLITCVVQRGLGDAVIRAAREAGAQGATVHFARGTGVRERLGLLGVAVEAEKEVIEVLVSTEQQDRVFEAMFLAGRLDTPGMGILYATPLEKAATYVPPEVLDKLESRQGRRRPR